MFCFFKWPSLYSEGQIPLWSSVLKFSVPRWDSYGLNSCLPSISITHFSLMVFYRGSKFVHLKNNNCFVQIQRWSKKNHSSCFRRKKAHISYFQSRERIYKLKINYNTQKFSRVNMPACATFPISLTTHGNQHFRWRFNKYCSVLFWGLLLWNKRETQMKMFAQFLLLVFKRILWLCGSELITRFNSVPFGFSFASLSLKTRLVNILLSVVIAIVSGVHHCHLCERCTC